MQNCYGGSELVENEVNREGERLNVTPDELSDAAIWYRLAIPQPLPLPIQKKAKANLIVSKALLRYQTHRWTHARSCFKPSKRTPTGTICRMFFPKELQGETAWMDDGTLQLKRSMGSEYLNTYVPIINATLKMNHDVKFLSAGEGIEKAFYMMKYSTKPQNEIENPIAIHTHAFDKALAKRGEDNGAVSEGRRFIQSMCCTLSNPQEVSAPMAALFVLRESPFYSSCQFTKLFLGSFLRVIFDNEDMDVMLHPVGSGSAYQPSSPLLDYIQRPHEMSEVHLMEFFQSWIKSSDRKGFPFQAKHLQCASHSMHKRKIPSIATIVGYKFPDNRNNQLTGEQLKSFQRAMLVLFHPFRARKDINPPGQTLDCFYHEWWNTSAPEEAVIFETNSLDFYASRELARSRTDADSLRYRDCVKQEGEDAQYFHDGIEQYNDGDFDVHVSDDLSDDEFSELLELPVKNISLLARASESASLAAYSNGNRECDERLPEFSGHELDMSIAELGQSSLRNQQVGSLQDTQADLATQVRMLRDASTQSEWIDPQNLSCPHPVDVQPSLSEVSSYFRLNRKQHKMFVHAGKSLLQSLQQETTSGEEQMIGFLGGLPGAGKSQVIKALQTLAEKWGIPGAIATVAYQGVAAQAANGETLHKFFGWGIHPRQRKQQYTMEQKEKFAKLRMLIIDEVSTMDEKFLGMADATLRDVKSEPNIVFGGVHVQLVGDWLQQLPVAGYPAYCVPSQADVGRMRPNDAKTYFDRLRGNKAYQAVNYVVILDENMRHRNDPKWRDILNRWRVGNYLQDDIDIVNAQCYHANWSVDIDEGTSYYPIIVTSNTLRAEFNEDAAKLFCKKHKFILHVFPATITRSRKPLATSQRRSLNNIRDDKTGNMSVQLKIAVGMPVQCSKNVSTSLKLANGSIGHVVKIQADPNDDKRKIEDSGITYQLHSMPPDVVYVQLRDRGNQSLFPALPDGVVPVRPREEPSVQINILQRSFAVKITQAPIVPAFALTSEKCQGLTVERMILAPLRHHTRRVPQTSSFYVAVTRVKSMDQLFLMEPLTLEYLNYFKPQVAALAEMARLEYMERCASSSVS